MQVTLVSSSMSMTTDLARSLLSWTAGWTSVESSVPALMLASRRSRDGLLGCFHLVRSVSTITVYLSADCSVAIPWW
jgi:hypothetical protein